MIPNDTGIRNPYYRDVIDYAFAQIVVTSENTSANSVNYFLNNVMNADGLNRFSAGTFVDGFDTDNAIYYRNTFFQFVSNTPIQTGLRDINEFKLIHLATGNLIRIYACHLKAGSAPADAAQRNAEIATLRNVTNALPAGSNFIVCGDMNTYSNTEPCYLSLLQDNITDDGNVIDPFNMPGIWSQPIYSAYHTQSTRSVSFGGGASGGLDDRFDLILYSGAIAQAGGMQYISNSCTAIGNDGYHLNDDINLQPNTAVFPYIADALYFASDHLPVSAVFTLQSPTGLSENNDSRPFEVIYHNGTHTLEVETQVHFTKAVEFCIYDSKGSLIWNGSLSDVKKATTVFYFNLPELKPGMYIFTSYCNGQKFSNKIMVM